MLLDIVRNIRSEILLKVTTSILLISYTEE